MRSDEVRPKEYVNIVATITCIVEVEAGEVPTSAQVEEEVKRSGSWIVVSNVHEVHRRAE